MRPPPPIYNHIPTYGQNFAMNQSTSQNWRFPPESTKPKYKQHQYQDQNNRDSRYNPTIHKTVTKELPTQRTLANWTAAFPQKTKKVHRATYANVLRDQVDVIGNLQEIRQSSPQQWEIQKSTRAAFNQNQVDPTCQLCHVESETLEHVLIRCNALSPIRMAFLLEYDNLLKMSVCTKCSTNNTIVDTLCILNPSAVFCGCGNCTQKLNLIEHLSRRMCFSLHVGRNSILNALPIRNREGLRAATPL
ncbi:unnamed protein product [Mytilus edulis]|uniref:Reverse transcriptase zinc-binding domain-containing protein n=1 Tax=Mytilus edulis TaxID=6550 RepID=A0A8S3PUX4_MYTED|nr:unnamed protein product [Mytilus edulis]